jgi:hypothetical protein
MVEIILLLNGSRCDLLVPKKLDTAYDSPLCRSEVLHYRMTDTQLYSQIPSSTCAFETSGQESLCTRLPAGGSVKSRFTENFRPGNNRPITGQSKAAPPADTVEELVPIWTVRHGRFIERTNMNTELARIPEDPSVTGSEKSKHPAIPGVGHVIGATSGGNDDLCTCT